MLHPISSFERTIVTFRDHVNYCHEPQSSDSHAPWHPRSSHLRIANKRYRSEPFTRAIRDQTFRHLNSTDLRKLRLTSNVICRVVQERFPALFQTVSIDAIVAGDENRWRGFGAVAEHVRHLTIVIGDQSDVKQGTIASTVARELCPASKGQGEELVATSCPSKTQGSNHRPEHYHGNGNSSKVEQSPARGRMVDSVTQFEEENTMGEHWLPDLSKCLLLRSLTVRVQASDPWPGRTQVEERLLAIRRALEAKSLCFPDLKEFRLTPIHALGILHMNWQGFSSLGVKREVIDPQCLHSNVWTRLERLTIHIAYPGCKLNSTETLTTARTTLFFKSLYHYLRAFTPTLQQLTFIWLGKTPGPCPLMLHLHSCLGMRKVPPLQWSRLTELRSSNTTLLQRSIELATQVAPRLNSLQTLRSSTPPTPRAKADGTERSTVWVNVLPGNEAVPQGVRECSGDCKMHKLADKIECSSCLGSTPSRTEVESKPDSRRSSVYSLASEHYVDGARRARAAVHEDELNGAVSHTSCNVPIMLDLKIDDWGR